MEEFKKCPICGEEVMSSAKKCKHCGEWLDEKSRIENQNMLERPSFFYYYLYEPYIKNFCNFKGKMPLRQYCIFYFLCVFFASFFMCCVYIACEGYGIDEEIADKLIDKLVMGFSCFYFIPMLACDIRRLRDMGKSEGWFLFIVIWDILSLLQDSFLPSTALTDFESILDMIFLIIFMIIMTRPGECVSKNTRFRFSDFLILSAMLFMSGVVSVIVADPLS